MTNINKPRIFLNQAGFAPNADKTAYLPFKADSFTVEDENGNTVFTGIPSFYGFDEASGDEVCTADFSSLKEKGRYRVRADGKCSAVFAVGDVYKDVCRDAMRAFYYLRCGCGLDRKHAGDYEHKPCHTADAVLWEDNSVSREVTGGWHDAGDYGRYVTAGAVALAHMLYAYKMFPDAYKSIRTNIPDSCEMPDLLTECRTELLWIMKMQNEQGGVYHKATTKGHAPFIMPEEDISQMYLLPVSSMATADTAAVLALASGIYKEFDSGFADKLKRCAERSYSWLEANPDFVFNNPPECTTGGYGERDDTDNRFWAASEMYALTGEEKYHSDIARLMESSFRLTGLGYGDTGGFGSLAYILSGQKKDEALQKKFLKAYEYRAKELAELSDSCGYGTALRLNEYCWGSNMIVLKAGMSFVIAAELCGKKEYIPYAVKQADYILGANALGISYLSGTGEYSINYPHLRPAAADGIEKCHEGMISGGPNSRPSDEDAVRLIPDGTPPMKCFADVTECYSLNEITIYWNSPAVFLFGYLSK
ncbi:MAG: glycoside hydrolase family 9 protein [Oscillospiraceae bacterium]|nr:glycoside hydrolase family 9 protein [Oscillospiraceae bacterium]